MVKKGETHKVTAKKEKTSAPKDEHMEKILIENFISLQKVMTNLFERFDNLSNKITGLLDLFEDSAKVLVKKDFDFGKDNKYNIEMLSRIDKLLEQNKIIAKGMTILHESKDSIPERIPLENREIQQKHILNKRSELRGIRKPRVEEEKSSPTFEIPE